MIETPRLVIAGTHSGVGKTTIATALMAAYTRRGLRVQPFKVGPDFIDPGFHEVACGRTSRNLDGWMLSRAVNLDVFGRGSADADLAIVEGVMGLFDGRDAAAESGSTAEMAKWLGAPVLLVADASAMARSAAALVHGFETFDAELDLAGVLFNRIGGQRHADILREAVTAYCRTTIVGTLPRHEKMALPSRHLGLTMARESLTTGCLDEMVTWLEKNVDLDALLDLAKRHSRALEWAPAEARSRPLPDGRGSADGCKYEDSLRSHARKQTVLGVSHQPARVRIGVARDAAFCFYYPDNLDLLRRSGADLVEFSPLADYELPPDVHGLYLGGGYPEIHGARLSENGPMLQAIHQFACAGGPIYAECGGFMYLTEAIVDTAGQEYPMAGLFPTRARMQTRFAALGYKQVEPSVNSLWLKADDQPRGHEFRYSSMDPMPAEVTRAYRSPAEGYIMHSVLGSYIHLHFLSCPHFAERFVDHCVQWSSTT